MQKEAKRSFRFGGPVEAIAEDLCSGPLPALLSIAQMDASPLDLSSVCLVCLHASQEYCCIFANDKDTPEMQIVDKITACSSLVLPPKIIPRVPDKICNDCLSELSATWRFRKKCEAANQVFESLQHHEIHIEELPNEVLEEHKLKLPSGIKVRRIHLKLKLPTKADTLRLHESSNHIEEEDNHKLDKSANLSPTMSAGLEADYDIDQQSLVLTSPSAPSPAAQTEVFEEHIATDVADVVTLNNTDASSKEDNLCGPQIEYLYDAVEYFDDLKDELSITMPKSKLTCRHTVNAIDNSLSVETSGSLPVDWTDQDQQETIKLEPVEDSNDAQLLVGEAKPGADSKAATQRKSCTADASVASSQQHKYMAAIKSERKSTKCARPSKICDVCGNTYKYQHALDAHIRRHNNERPYPCEVCNKAFVSNVELRRHMRVHTGQKPYGCKFCDRRFSDFGSSKKHERIHTGERPYVCEVCNKGFAYAHVLTVHKRTHTGEKQFPCTHCDKGFTKKAYLLAHIEGHKRAKHLPYIAKDLKLNSADYGLRGITMGNDVLLPTDDEDGIDENDAVINDCTDAINTVVFNDDKVLEECIVNSDFMGDTENLPDDHHVVVDADVNSAIAVGIPTNDIVADVQDVVHAGVYPVLLSAHYLDDTDQLEHAKFMLQ